MSERKVLRIPQSEPSFDNIDDLNDSNFEDNMNMDMGNEPNFGEESEDENVFDSNFDAGVEANEEEDPKKFIEQLTGKLSQSLNKYQENQPQVDAATSKYVAGMIIKAATKGLSQTDVTDILNKVKEDSEENQSKIQTDDSDNIEQEDSMNMKESVDTRQRIEELFQDLSNPSEENIQEPIKRVSFKKKPFTSPKF